MTKGRSTSLIAALAAVTVAALVWLGIVRPQQLRESESRAAAIDMGTRDQAGKDATGKAPAADLGKADAPKGDLTRIGKPGGPSGSDTAAITQPGNGPKAGPADPKAAAQADTAASNTAGAPLAPSFDVVRVEPSGEAVLAGRSVPGATIELLRDGEPYARAIADMSGLFAVVPPALAPGPHEIVLQSIAPDGARTQSRQSVTIVIAKGRDTKPLVALASPDKPTVVLSRPETPERDAAGEVASAAPKGGTDAKPAEGQVTGSPPAPDAAAQPPRARAPVKIVSVETEEGGRLLVAGSAAPGATVRLYLNDGFVAPGGVGADGKLSYMIERGMRPGDYRVRLDDVDPVSGDVKTRAEVNFVVPPGTEPGQVQTAGRDAAGAGKPEAARTPQGATGEGPPAPKSAAASSRLHEPNLVVIPEVNTAMVARGDNLWSISRRLYGHGMRYTVIYGANQGQIRNPSLIYPGQIFLVPQDSSEAGEPRKASR